MRIIWILSCLCWLAIPTSAAQPPPGLANGGFEETNIFTAWKTWIYKDGADPVIRADRVEAKEGQHALLIGATDPADVALGQTINLPPGSVWRVGGWIKTEDLKPRDHTDTAGALHVQTPDGSATLSRSPSSFGSTPWHEVQVPFRVPEDGRVKIVLFYIGYGKGTGKAWFDGLRLEPVRAAGEQGLLITAERLTRLAVDQKQGGQFIEPLCNLIPSMLAQQVANTSFEVDPPWRFAFRREVDRPHRPWYPDGAVHLATYTYDTNRPGNGVRSLRIDLPVAGAWTGVSQDGFYFGCKQSYRLRLQARCQPAGETTRPPHGVPIRATLHGDGKVVGRVTVGTAGTEWSTLEAEVRAGSQVLNGTLTLDFQGPATVWIDRVTLIDSDSVLGLWRKDVVRALCELKPGVIRFGGSILESYEWSQSLGSPDKRAPFADVYWGGIEENFVGVEEFVAFCREVGAEPLVCVRWTGKKPEDAAAEVQYFNGEASTQWGKLRAQNGRIKPWAVRYWQIGNEVGGPEYEASLPAFAQAMKKADPSVSLLSSYPSAEILKTSGELDYLCPHHYGCADLVWADQEFVALENQIRRFGGATPVRIAVTEWNTTAGGWELGRASLQTLANALACSRYHNLMHRHADSVEIAIRSNLIDSFGSGVIQTGPGWSFLAPTYHAQWLYTRAAGSYPLKMLRSGDAPGESLPWHLEQPDVSAVLSPDGRTLRVYGVNATGKEIVVKSKFKGLSLRAGKHPVFVLHDSTSSASPEVQNTRDEPTRVRIFRSTIRATGEAADLHFTPFSLTLYEMAVRAR